MYVIKLNRKQASFTVKTVSQRVRFSRPEPRIVLRQTGRRGPEGDKGADGRVTEIVAGPGIIVDDTNVARPVVSAVGGTGDKTYVEDFTMQHTLTITHDLQKYPAVTVINSAGDKVESTVEYIDTNNVTINFTRPFSGRVSLN